MTELIETIRDFTIAHPYWAMALYLTIGFTMGIILIVSITIIGQEESGDEKTKQLKTFINKR